MGPQSIRYVYFQVLNPSILDVVCRCKCKNGIFNQIIIKVTMSRGLIQMSVKQNPSFLCGFSFRRCMWTTTVTVPKGVVTQYRYFKGFFLQSKSAGGPCQVIVNMWETHHRPRTMSPTGIDQQKTVQGLAPVSITKKKFKKSRFRY
uniref:Glycerophosphocholine phosphodiesterase 1 n=1 Tax=Neolamprologus brichardi TaxID=32507 RepID=A0A3Q4HW64_NEOBR